VIVFLYGTDAYRRVERTGWWIGEYKKKHGLSPTLRLDMMDEDALPALREFLGNVSMFDPYKLAVLRNAFGSSRPSALAKFLQGQAEPGENIIVISEEKKPPAAFAFLTTKARCETFDAPTGPALQAFVKQEAARRGIELERAAVRAIERASGGDTWWIATELDRAALLGATIVTLRDLPGLDLEEAGVEGLLEELRSFSRSARLAALEKLVRRRHDPAMIFNRLAYRDAKKLPVFADYDVLVKSGKLDYEEALLALAIN
jgi:DNA polymerase III delta subunit